MNDITAFRGIYYFLSNMYPCQVTYKGITYKSSENAYQAQKTNDVKIQYYISELEPKQSKIYAKNIKLSANWHNEKINVMREILYIKFSTNNKLKELLLATGEAYLEENNYHNDYFWGVCKGIGKNNLGNLLMEIRSRLKEEQ